MTLRIGLIAAAAILIIAYALISAAPAQTISTCGPYKSLTEHIGGPKYTEQMRFRAIVKSSGNLFELWVNEDTGTATSLLVNPQSGLACISGRAGYLEAAEFHPAKPAGEGI